jgi:hypothetical protein
VRGRVEPFDLQGMGDAQSIGDIEGSRHEAEDVTENRLEFLEHVVVALNDKFAVLFSQRRVGALHPCLLQHPEA